MMTSLTPWPSRSESAGSALPVLRHYVVEGVVQGVGFRPFVHRTATALGLAGSVRNDGARVLIEARGDAVALEAFHRALLVDAPPLARVEQVTCREGGATGAIPHAFTIDDSTAPSVRLGTAARLTADAGICEACESELMDSGNRRYRHLFISCTDCGPRWSMTEALPYDRVRTTMQAFPPCAACEREYRTSDNRRFHAESICCPACGPTLTAYGPTGTGGAYDRLGTNGAALAAASSVLRAGGIVALHGIGGFHLAVNAADADAVARLRARKHRPAKPFAVMVRTIEEALALVTLDAESAALLRGPERPVVIAARRTGEARGGLPLAPGVAPGLAELGVMLPGTAVQHLLLHDTGLPLVMTSGNASGEPLAATPDDAWRDLADIADLLLVHDRPVVAPSDDTVLRREPRGVLVMRRARGWSPARVAMPVSAPVPVLGLGADLKATVALGHGHHCWLSPHLGDQSSLAVQERTAATVARLLALSGVSPDVVACDAHPGYASTAMLERWLAHPAFAPWGVRRELPVVQRIQHHHAHVAAVLVEHAVTHPVVALAFDGAGWGLDGTVWGGDVLVADLVQVERVGALMNAPLLGGDLAAREPWRAALGWLHDHDGPALTAVRAAAPADAWRVADALARRGTAMHSSSMGRLFDAAAAVLDVVPRNSYEGEAAARMEALAHGTPVRPGVAFPFISSAPGTPWRLDPRSALDRLAAQRARGHAVQRLAAQWHDDVVATAVMAAHRAVDENPATLATVALCGGVFQNARLLHAVRGALEAHGMRVLAARLLPPNDGAIAVGQVAIASARCTHDGRAHSAPATSFASLGSTS
jgi:hydrogenase maturation protein HypF